MKTTALLSVATLCTLLASPTELRAAEPDAVSPGSLVAFETLSEACPTFSWSEVGARGGYELVVYREADDGALEILLEASLPAGASSWTPSARQCPKAGGRHAWAVRSLTDARPGGWSELMLFETDGAPTDHQVREALEVLKRYQPADQAGKDQPAERLSSAQRPSTSLAKFQSDRLPERERSRALFKRSLVSSTMGAGPSPSTVTTPASFSLSLDGDVNLGGAVFKEGYPFLHADGGYDFLNTALGMLTLANVTPGLPEPVSGSRNSAFGAGSLYYNTSGFRNTATGFAALLQNTSGYRNTANGQAALASNTEGSHNTASGAGALYSNTTGRRNAASGYQALFSNTDGDRNTATGYQALYSNSLGHENVAVGNRALPSNTEGNRNTAVGFRAIRDNTTGSFNTAVGTGAGLFWTAGDNNIALGHGAQGLPAETGVIRIGGSDNQTKTFIEGINAAAGTFPTDVCIDANDQLGPCSASSARFKHDVKSLGDVRDDLSALRPVTFRYKEEYSGEAQPTLHHGLIAEEVAMVLPGLVTFDSEGRAHTVRYDLLTPLLLAEVRRQDREIERLQGLEKDVAELRRRVGRLQKRRR